MGGIRRSTPLNLRARIRQRRYLRWAAETSGSHHFASMGAGSVVHPPSAIIGHHRIHVGNDVQVNSGAFLSVIDELDGKRYDARLVIGDGVRIGSDMVIACCGSVEIGDEVLTADRVFIGDTYHEYRDTSRSIMRQGLHDPRPVSIGRGAFLGVNSSVLPGVTIGEGACIGAGAVVTSDVPPHSVAVGNPARVVRRFDGSRWVDV